MEFGPNGDRIVKDCGDSHKLRVRDRLGQEARCPGVVLKVFVILIGSGCGCRDGFRSCNFFTKLMYFRSRWFDSILVYDVLDLVDHKYAF